MASNTYAPFGFRESRLYGAAPSNYAMQATQIAYNNSNKIAFGDPVKLLSTGYIDVMTVSGSTIHGIFLGCEYYDPVLQNFQFLKSWPAPGTLTSSQTVSAHVAVDPLMRLQVQVNGGPVVQGNVGNNIDIFSGSSGNPSAAGISQCAVDFSTIASTSTLPFRIVGIVQNGGYNGTSWYAPGNTNNIVEVVMNTSDITSRTGI